METRIQKNDMIKVLKENSGQSRILYSINIPLKYKENRQVQTNEKPDHALSNDFQ